MLACVQAGLLQNTQSAYSNTQYHPVPVQTPLITGSVQATQPIGVASGPVLAAAPVVQTRVEPYDPNPRYNYAYAVNDQRTGDVKSQHESRNGDVVHGQYTINDPDGSRRVVDYSAGPYTGFNAIVQRTPGAHPVPVATVAAVATPIH